MYVGVKLLSALYANIALLYINRLGIDCQLYWPNISRDGVIKFLKLRKTFNIRTGCCAPRITTVVYKRQDISLIKYLLYTLWYIY